MGALVLTRRRLRSTWPSLAKLVGAAVTVATWQVLTWAGIIEGAFIADPLSVGDALTAGLSSGELIGDALTSIHALGIAMFFCCLMGFPIGILLGLRPRAFEIMEPIMGFGLSIPIASFLSLIIVMMGFGFRTVALIGWISGLLYIVMNTAMGVMRIEPDLKDAGRVFCGSPIQQARRVWVHAALPTILAGIRLSSGRALAGITIGEMFASNEGLGARLVHNLNYFNVPEFYAVLIVLAAVASTAVLGVGSLERRTLRAQVDS